MQKNKTYDTIIVGGGAAGLMCAALAARRGVKVLLLEKMEKCGRKIRITGKGRCNLTNNKDMSTFLSKVRSGSEFITEAYSKFTNNDTAQYFESIGLALSTLQGGRIYPASGDAWDVVRMLEREIIKYGGEIKCNSEVNSLLTENKVCCGVELSHGDDTQELHAKSVVLATGGVSYPTTGSTGDGYRMADEVGHNIVAVMPALVPFNLGHPFSSQLGGLVLKNIELSLLINNTKTASELGEVEFFRFGIGGGAVFRLSREAVEALYEDDKVVFSLDLKPALSATKLLGRFERECTTNPHLKVNELLRKLLPQQIIPLISQSLSFRPTLNASAMTEANALELIDKIKNLRFTVASHRGFREAVITVGGVSLEEVNPRTMESLKIKNLYLGGELLDLDADTGGYNLQLAFTTAHAIAQNL